MRTMILSERKSVFCPYLTTSRLYNRTKIKKMPMASGFLELSAYTSMKRNATSCLICFHSRTIFNLKLLSICSLRPAFVPGNCLLCIGKI